ncbi:hypothetical protein PFDG_02438 [Plasmodium falciparum Dd2]|uniref:Uncharacterized protein n=1 Tax=Plasmodium falciparum (isolate Dd2) TaxID=57267 RepID=A0A0L7M1K3_PLAF4|nr:hypothetical protein PFDG_02438 [Plasmodium falciparum Dd2]
MSITLYLKYIYIYICTSSYIFIYIIILICFLNKYKIIHKYINYILSISLNTIDDYNKLINKILCLYKQNVYNADKNINEIKEKLKKAVKLTKTNVKIKDDNQEEQKAPEIDPNLKINLPYNIISLYKLRYYKNLFFKNYSTITKNDNYLNANEQRKNFLLKLKCSANVSKRNNNTGSDIFQDDYKNMLRILNENTFYNESQKLKDILIINKYLNKAKYLIHNMPQFLCTIIEEFELTESNFHEHMYLFILLAINKWFKRIIVECERFISYNKGHAYKKNTETNEIYKKFNEYMNDILQRGAEQTVLFNEEKCFYCYPSNLNFNMNTSFLTYYFLYINKSLFNFLGGIYSHTLRKGETNQDPNKKRNKLILLNDDKEDSVYMKSDIYNYNLYNEYSEMDYLNDLCFHLNNEKIYPNIFLICNYLLQEETINVMNIIYEIQRGAFDVLILQDISIVIQIVLFFLKNLKNVFKEEIKRGNYQLDYMDRKDNIEEIHENDKKKKNSDKMSIKEKEQKNEKNEKNEEYDECDECDEYEDFRKCISTTILNYSYSNDYDELLIPLRLMFLNILKFIHVTVKSEDRKFICTFWQKDCVSEHTETIQKVHDTELEEMNNIKIMNKENIQNDKDSIVLNKEDEQTNILYNNNSYDLRCLKYECNENNCYVFNQRKNKKIYENIEENQNKNKNQYQNKNIYHQIYNKENINLVINKRILCYDFYKAVVENVQKVKHDIENKNNRDIYTGILLKKSKYKIDNDKKTPNITTMKPKNNAPIKKCITQRTEPKGKISESTSAIKNNTEKMQSKNIIKVPKKNINSKMINVKKNTPPTKINLDKSKETFAKKLTKVKVSDKK